MSPVTAQEVQALRRATGVGMMDAKRALEASSGDFDKAVQWLREQGLARAAARADRVATEGAVAVVREGPVAAIVELRSETDFVAKSAEFVNLADELAALVAARGEAALAERQDEIDRLGAIFKENISVGRVARLEAGEGEVIDTYLHQQAGRGVNGVIVVLAGGDQALAHEVALNVAFSRPAYLRREDVPPDEVEAERQTIEAISRKEGKPEAALPKIIEGRLNGWFRERVLLEQPYIHDEKRSVAQLLGDATVTRFAQVVIGP